MRKMFFGKGRKNKMKISNETIAKVFAPYLFQNLECVIKTGDHWQQRSYLYEVNSSEVIVSGKSFPFSRPVRFNECKLILKPLSAISDEDAIEVAKLLNDKCKHFSLVRENPLTRVYVKRTESDNDGAIVEFNRNHFWYEYDGNTIPVHSDVHLHCYQFLQSRGYDLPMWQLGGKTLHEAGLAIYENDKINNHE
jgi:hypothetical protein